MIPKRTIQEWLTIARIYPGVKRIFVEGRSDAALLTVFSGYDDAFDIKTADDIDLDIDNVDSFLGGNRLRLNTLAGILQENNCTEFTRVLIDRDFEDFLPRLCASSAIVITDGANLPFSCFCFEWIRDLFMKSFGYLLDINDWKFITDCLAFLFSARYVFGSRAPAIALRVKPKSIVNSDGIFTFYREDIILASTGLSQHSAEYATIKSEIDAFQAKLAIQPRCYCNSNDIVEVCLYFLKAARAVSQSYSPDAMRHLLVANSNLAYQPCPNIDGLIAWACSK